MATLKVKFRPSAVRAEGTVYYQIIHDRRVVNMSSGCRLNESDWDSRRCAPAVSALAERQAAVQAACRVIAADRKRLARIERRLAARGPAYSADELVAELARYRSDYTLFNFMDGIIARLKSGGRIRTSETYRAALYSFRRFRGGADLPIDCLDADMAEAYEGWLRNRGISPNTCSFYARILRAVYNRAVELDIVDDCRPFRHVYTGVDKTVKRALPLSVLTRLKSLDLSDSPRLDYARDIFLLSFYLRGMSFIDMAFLRKTDLKDCRVTYRRRKTGRLLMIGWTGAMQAIVDKYRRPDSPWLLPILGTGSKDERSAYHRAAGRINGSLRQISARLGLATPFTLYAARHSWASAARAKGVPVGVISEGMGHDSETTTRIYLDSLDTSLVDKANELIIRSI